MDPSVLAAAAGPPPAPNPPAGNQDAAAPSDDARTSITRPQRNSFISLLYLSTAFFFFMNSGNNADLAAQDRGQRTLLSLAYQLKNYTLWLNGTASNFSMPPTDIMLPPLVDWFVPWTGTVDGTSQSYFRNITGYITGDATFHNLTHTPDSHNESSWQFLVPPFMEETNMTELVGRLGDVNWTAMNSVGLSLTEKEAPRGEGSTGDLSIIRGRVEVADDEGNSAYLELEGIRYLMNGSVYGILEPQSKHVDIRLLPSIVPASLRNTTAYTIALEFAVRLDRFRTAFQQGALDMTPEEEGAKFKCPFELFGQVVPSNISYADMEIVEEELEEPTGRPTPRLPKLSLKGVLISKECGILYEFRETEGLKTQRFWQKVTTYAGVSSLVNLVLLLLLTRQMDASRTPATLSRISRWSVLVQVVADCITAAAHITIGVLADGRPSLSLIAPAFLALLLVINEMQFLATIQQAQGPEDARRNDPRPRPPPPAPATDEEGQLLPTTIAPEPPRPPLIVRVWNVIRPEANARAWILSLSLITVVARLFVSASFELYLLLLIYSVVWIPQVVRNTGRATAHAFSFEYVLGNTVFRAFFPLYLFACPKGLGGLETDDWQSGVVVFLSFTTVTTTVILLQDRLGPRFFLPRGYSSIPIYNYHPPLPLPDREAPEQSLGDCSICMDAIYVDPSLPRRSLSTERKEKVSFVNANGRGDGAAGERRRLMGSMAVSAATSGRKSYSLAPCHHLFHTECLETWLAIKSICPQCRRPLPPLA